MKDIPDDLPEKAVAVVKNNPFITTGVIVVFGLGAYLYMRSPVEEGTPTVYDAFGGTGYSSPTAYPINDISGDLVGYGGGGSSTYFDPNAVTDREIFDFEVLKEGHDYELSMETLKRNTDIALANATLQLQGIQASNFGSAALLASSMLASNSTSVIGAIVGPNGEQWSFGLAQTLGFDGKNKKKLAAVTTTNQQGLNAFNAFMASIGTNNVQHGTGSTVYEPPSGTTSFQAGNLGTNFAAATIDAGYSNNGGQSSTIVQSASAAQIANESNGAGGNVNNQPL